MMSSSSKELWQILTREFGNTCLFALQTPSFLDFYTK